MKFYHFFLLGLFFILIQPIFSQDAQPILRNEFFFSKNMYQFPDGTSIPNKKVISIISEIPDNASLMKQEKRWRIAAYTLSVLCIASLGVYTTYQCVDLPYNKEVSSISLCSSLLFYLYGVLSGQIANNKLQRSIDNYNLYIYTK